MGETKELLVPGLATPEGEKRITNAIDKRNYCDYQCFMMLREVQSHGVLDGAPFDLTDGDDKNLLARVNYWIRRRETWNNEFLEAAAGRENPNAAELEDDGPPTD